jgi:subtilisin family serine protease
MSCLPYFRSRIRWRMRWMAVASLTSSLLFGAGAAASAQAQAAAAPKGARLGPHLAALARRKPGLKATFIFQFKPSVTEAQARLLITTHAGRVKSDLPIIHGLAVRMSLKAAARLQGNYAIREIDLNGRVKSQDSSVDTTKLQSYYELAAHADHSWTDGLTGAGIGVAVIDSGVAGDLPDFATSPTDPTSRVVESAVVNPGATEPGDPYGHGTHVAGIIAGNGWNLPSSNPLQGDYVGVAPQANLISIKAGDEQGNATVLDVIDGLQFAIDHQADYNIRVVNLSLESDTPQSYLNDPLDAAAEAAWFHGIVVVAAAGNLGTAPDAVDYAPGNDPYVITVGSINDDQTTSHYVQLLHQQHQQAEQALKQSDQQAEQALRQSDQQAEAAASAANLPALQKRDRAAEAALQQADQQKEQALAQSDQQAEHAAQVPGNSISSFSSRGTTQDGVAKPDVYAPGAHIVSALAPGSAFAQMCGACTVGGSYIRASGTSMSAPVVSGAVADLLQANPTLTPDQVKAALTARGQKVAGSVAPALAIDQAEKWHGGSANQGLTPSALIDTSSGSVDYSRSSWRRSSWRSDPGSLTAPWARSSWRCVCGAGGSDSVDPTRSGWSRSTWSTDLTAQ